MISVILFFIVLSIIFFTIDEITEYFGPFLKNLIWFILFLIVIILWLFVDIY